MSAVPPPVTEQRTQQRTRQRSLGASLLDQVFAETLDPAYAQAAEARAARGKAAAAADESRARSSDGRVVTAGRPETGRLRQQGLVAVVMALAGLLVALTHNQSAAGSEGRAQVRAALIADIQAGSTAGDELRRQLADLQTQVEQQREAALAASSVGQRALEQLAAAQAGAAAVAVTGPGLLVTLGDPEPSADDDPVGDTAAPDPDATVLDRDLQLLVNSLWSAGAEAIAVDGQRIGPTTAVRQAGGAVLVDFRPVTSPYEVQAVGDPEDLSSAFLDTPEATYLANLSVTYGLVFEFSQSAELTLPAASETELLQASPVPPAASTPPGGTPTTTPGG